MKAIAFVLLFFTCAIADARDYSSWLENCSKYRETVESILEKENISKDYYYLMVAESRCTLKAESHKGARGFWQLMPRTGKHYGCSNLDNIECSTRAAILSLSTIIQRFTVQSIHTNSCFIEYHREFLCSLPLRNRCRSS